MKKYNILVIDDDRLIRALFQEYLEDEGFNVITAESGGKGLESYHKDNPDLILLDLSMDDMNGYEVIKRIRQREDKVPIIVVSATNSVEEAVEAIRKGANDYLIKPLSDIRLIKDYINKNLERDRLKRQNLEYKKKLEEQNKTLSLMNKKLEKTLSQIRRDEESGKKVQLELLPESTENIGEFNFSSYFKPSTYLSGDMLDFFDIDENYLGAYLADVSGHGISSSLITVLLKSYIEEYLNDYNQGVDNLILSPAKMISKMNERFVNQNYEKHFTIFYFILDKKEKKLICSNGGQFPFPIISSPGKAEFVDFKSYPVGILPSAVYDEVELDLEDKFRLVLMSDGILEVINSNSLAYKQNFLLDLVKSKDFTIDKLVDRLSLNQLESLPDDISILMVESRDL